MASVKPLTIPAKRLSQSITGAATTFALDDILGWDGDALVAADFGTLAYGSIRDSNSKFLELFSFDPSTIASGSISFVKRGLGFDGDFTTEVADNKLSWTKGSIVELGSSFPALFKHFVDDLSAQNVSGAKTFDETTMPRISVQHAYGAGEEEYLATKRYVDGVAIAGAPNASTTAKGLVQLPTQAQVDAKTTTGSTGALLSLTPDKQRSTLLSDYVADTGAADAYVITPVPAATAYTTGQRFTFKAANTNTTAATLNVSALGTKSIKKYGSIALVAGDIVSGQVYEVEYDGTNFQLLGYSGAARQSQNGAENYAVDGGSANAYTATLVPAVGSYTAGLRLRVKIANSSTGASTLNVNGLGTKNIFKLGSVAITKGDLVAGQIYDFTYDGTQFQTIVDVQRSSGVLSAASNSGANTITTGFKPRRIRFTWIYVNSGTGPLQQLMGAGTWIAAGTYAEVYGGNSGASGGGATATVSSDTSAVVSGAAANNTGNFSGTIGNLTDTGFDLTLANATGATPTLKILWEADTGL